jgi:hypothetical protein
MYQKNTKWIPIPLSHDHKPENEEEKNRIIDSGGVVEKYMDKDGRFYGPYRVW